MNLEKIEIGDLIICLRHENCVGYIMKAMTIAIEQGDGSFYYQKCIDIKWNFIKYFSHSPRWYEAEGALNKDIKLIKCKQNIK